MESINTIISELEAYSKLAGLKPATVCSNATKNARLYDRLIRRAGKLEEDVGKLRAYMASNPITVGRGASQ